MNTDKHRYWGKERTMEWLIGLNDLRHISLAFGDAIGGLMGIGRSGGGFHSHFLEGGGVDHAKQEGGGTAVFVVQAIHDAVNGLSVVIFHATTDGVSEEFFRETAIKVDAMLGDEHVFRLAEAGAR